MLKALSPARLVPTAVDYPSDDDDADQYDAAQPFDWTQHGFQLDTGDLNAWLSDDDHDPPPLGIHIFRYDPIATASVTELHR